MEFQPKVTGKWEGLVTATTGELEEVEVQKRQPQNPMAFCLPSWQFFGTEWVF